jgi:DNA-binding SARP family transcriptional activator
MSSSECLAAGQIPSWARVTRFVFTERPLGEFKPRLELLDGFRLTVGGATVALPPGVQRLIAFLAIRERPLQRLFVAGSLWIESDEERANANLRSALWRLRHLGVPLVDATRTHLALATGVAVDLHETAARARRVLRSEPPLSLDELDADALGGELLPDWYDDWLLIERERFHQLRLHALEALCENLAAADAYGSAVEAGLACVAAEPLRESAHRALIRIHLSEGNSGEAIRAYRMYSKLALDELGLAPSEQMQRMVRALVIGDEVVTHAR